MNRSTSRADMPATQRSRLTEGIVTDAAKVRQSRERNRNIS